MTAHHIRYDVDADGIATLVIDRADKRNAMTWAMLQRFNDCVAEAGADDAVRVLIVAGSGGSFCAGTDLADLANTPTSARGGSGGRRMGWPLIECPKPVICAVDGAAVGMGAEFTSQCDIRIATPRARFGWNFAHRGLVPDMGAGSWVLPRLLGPSRALRLLYSGGFLDGVEAKAIGYVMELAEPDDLMAAARAEATRYLASSPFSLRRIKALVWEGLERDVESHMVAHHAALAECFASDDHREGVASFLERRPARFTGK
jgi:enoyl-CoA hydratase/carnithine racemase